MFTGMSTDEPDLVFELSISFGEAPDELVEAIDGDHLVEFVFEPSLDDLMSV